MSYFAKTHFTIDTDAFHQRFRPIPNHLDDNASEDFGDGGCLFETYGAELDYVRSHPSSRIWTIIDGEDDTVIVSGYHLCNRIGYILTEKPVPEVESYTVRDEFG